jgi:hypothetical protein
MERTLDPGAMQSARVRALRRYDGLAHVDPTTTSTMQKRQAHRQEVERLRLLAPRMIEAGQTRELIAWIDALPSELQSGEPWVLHFLGTVLRLSNDDPARAFRIQEEAREAFFQSENWTGYARSLTELGLLAAQLAQLSRHPKATPTDRQVADEHDAAGDAPLFGRDESVRARLAGAIGDGRITLHGLRLLRSDYALTPAEANVFIAYYLPKDETPAIEATRRDLSNELNLSENTLMHHITSIRRKLGFGSRRGSANVLLWCVSAGITDLKVGSRESGAGSGERDRLPTPLS